MSTIQFVTMPGCHSCEKARRTFKDILPDFPHISVEEIDATSSEGQALIQKHGIMSSPGIIINGELFSMGGVDKEKLTQKLQSLH